MTSSHTSRTFIHASEDSVYDRLVEVKTTYDPDNVFHHNQNIRPSPAPQGLLGEVVDPDA